MKIQRLEGIIVMSYFVTKNEAEEENVNKMGFVNIKVDILTCGPDCNILEITFQSI